MSKPKPNSRRYIGGLAVDMQLPSGRLVTLNPGDEIELLPSEIEAIDLRPDFTPIEGQPTVDPASDAVA